MQTSKLESEDPVTASIVIADPHAVVREGLRRLIEDREEWVVVAEADSGRRAVELAARLRPNLVIMEALLPRLCGVDATREIVRGGGGTKVLILSAQARQSVVESALRAGARGYLLKSASAKELAEAIEAVLQGSIYLSPSVTRHVVEAFTGEGERSARGLAALTCREREVLQLIAEGLSSKEVSSSLSVSLRTVESYRASLMQKLGIHKVSALVRYAIREGLVEA
jgi:two-component system response regulator NreC